MFFPFSGLRTTFSPLLFSVSSASLRLDLLCFPTSSTPQIPHSRLSISPEPPARHRPLVPPNQPKPTDQIAPPTQPHTSARFARHQFHPAAASQETIPLPERSPRSTFRAAPPAIVRSAPQLRKPPHRARSPIAPSPKTNAPPPQIPGMAHASNILDCASTQTPVSPNSRSRSDDTPPPPAPLAPSRKTPPSHLR